MSTLRRAALCRCCSVDTIKRPLTIADPWTFSRIYDPEIGRRSKSPTEFPFVEGVDEFERVMGSKQLVAVRVNVQGELPTVHDGVRVVAVEPPQVLLESADGDLLRVRIDSVTLPYKPAGWPGVIGRVLDAISWTR